MYKPTANLRLQKQLIINVLREHLSVRGYTSIELSRTTGMNLDNVRKYLRDMELGENRAYVAEWIKGRDGKWKGLWMFGNKPNAPRPPKCEATIRRQARRARRESQTDEDRIKLATAERARWQARQQAKERREEQKERDRRLAEIKPHVDPYAHFFHGGIKLLTGAQA